MTTKIRKFRDIIEAEHYLNGGVVGGNAAVVPGIVGKNLIVGATTVTFTAVGSGVTGDTTALFFKDIKSQIETAVAAVKVFLLDGKIAIIEKTPTSGALVTKDGTANAILGFQNNSNIQGKIFAPPPSATPPCWVWACIGLDNSHVIYTLE